MGVSGDYSTYTYTRPLVTYTGDHYYRAYIEILFHAPDAADHYYQVTTVVTATPTNSTPVHYGYNQNETTNFFYFHYWGASNSPFVISPYGGMATEIIHTNTTGNWSVDALVGWSGGLYAHGGSYSIEVTITDVGGGGIIYNQLIMVPEQPL